MEGLSINNIITNEDIVITYTPSVAYYSYVIIKDNVYGEPVYIYDGLVSEIKFTDEGTYKIEITENNKKIGEVNLVASEDVKKLNCVDIFGVFLGKWMLK